MMATPFAVFLAAFALYPIGFAIVLVFLKWDLVTPPSFAGLDNVRLLAVDGRFWQALANMLVFLPTHIPLQIASALALAMTLTRQLAIRPFWPAAFFLPAVLTYA